MLQGLPDPPSLCMIRAGMGWVWKEDYPCILPYIYPPPLLLQWYGLMEELVATEFFGFDPDRLYHEVYAIGYNEFLAAVSTLKETLLEEFPDKQEEVEKGCSSLLTSYSDQFDEEWFKEFLTYCSKNIFVVPRQVPVYAEAMGKEENQSASEKVEDLRHYIMATEYLNSQLEARLQEMDKEITRHKLLLEQVRAVEVRLQVVGRARELEEQLKELTKTLFEDDIEQQQLGT